MANLPPAMNFADAEEEIVKKWKDEDTFRVQDKLSLERGDDVSHIFFNVLMFQCIHCPLLF